jgi:uncharacterized protein (TIGR02246 family)
MIRVVAIGTALIFAAPTHAAAPSSVDQRALCQLASRMDQAWTAADATANADLFAVNATARFGDELLGEGRDAIRDQFRTFFQDRPGGLRHVTKIERVEQLATNLAMWDAEVRVEQRQANGNWAALTRIRNVTLIVRQSGGWRIQAVRAFPVR